jgi:predicted PurR-regulated permease PerM
MTDKQKPADPAQETLRSWAPRLLAFGLLALALVPLFGVFRPLFGFLLLAVSLAVLTSPLLFAPMDRLAKRRFPGWNSRRRRTACGTAATAILVLLAATPLLPLLTFSGSATEMMVGLAFGDEAWREVFLDGISRQVSDLKQLFPRLPLEEQKARDFTEELLIDTHQFSDSFLGYLFRGAGGFVAELVLSLMALSFLLAHGSELARTLLERAGFSEGEVRRLAKLHRRAVLRLWWDTLMTAAVRGLFLGGAAWIIGDFPFWPVALVGAFAGLVPVVGSAMVWLPLASLAWSRGEIDEALLLAIVCIVLNVMVSHGKRRFGAKLHEQGAWTSFLLFFSIIGGVLAYGVSGFVIGPAAVIAVSVLGSYLLPVAGENATTVKS